MRVLNSTYIVKKGYLIKSPPINNKSPITLRRWMRRFFVLYDDSKGQPLLFYFKNKDEFESGSDEKGKIILNDCIEVRKQEHHLFSRDYIVSLVTSPESPTHSGRIFHCCASNEEEQNDWFSILQSKILPKSNEPESMDAEQTDPINFSPPGPTPLERKMEEVRAKRGEERESIEHCEYTYQEEIKVKDISESQRDSRSSGYASQYSRASNSSWTSAFSDYSRSSQLRDIYEFSPVFVGPRIHRSTKDRSFSTSNLLGATEHDDWVFMPDQRRSDEVKPRISNTTCREVEGMPSTNDENSVVIQEPATMPCCQAGRPRSFPESSGATGKHHVYKDV